MSGKKHVFGCRRQVLHPVVVMADAVEVPAYEDRHRGVLDHLGIRVCVADLVKRLFFADDQELPWLLVPCRGGRHGGAENPFDELVIDRISYGMIEYSCAHAGLQRAPSDVLSRML